GVLNEPTQLRLFQAFSFAALEDDPEVASALEEFWRGRFAAAAELFERASERGEIQRVADPAGLVEQLVGPLYLRALVTRRPIDRALTRRSVDWAMALAGAR
ncbi:MAG TPA: TetR-like C-terminal domain-containing protein, partial [Solirubrobacteraceae bacterium]|nr:TetR-like C-terminal domain-containing protein [Solirubrobacteraceae bacterium]